MKNLATCTPVEFLRQTNKIRKSVESWLKETKIMEIRKNKPLGLIEITETMSAEERKDAEERNLDLYREQAMKNISKMLDVALDECAEQTLEVLGLMCFVDPDKVNECKPTALIKEFGEMIADEDILDFFTSLMQLDQTGIFEQSKK